MAKPGNGVRSLHILVVDDEVNIRKLLSISLTAVGHQVAAVSNFEDAISETARRSFDLAFVDLRLGAADGLDLIPLLLASTPWLKIVVITAYSSINTAVEAMRLGATDYIPKPFTPEQVNLVVRKIGEIRTLEQKVSGLQDELARSIPEADFVSVSPAMQRAVNLAREVAASDATVLILGENGTGKSLLARAIHHWSNRAEKPFCVISCPSIASELFENELFGHAKGSFTGAVGQYPGRIATCEGGTLLLDEIGDMPLSIQPKLLRFIQEREYERVGESTTRKADVRIIAATNADLKSMVEQGRFRGDLFYRLNVIQIELPALRQRSEDIPNLAQRLLRFFGQKNRHVFQGFTDKAAQALMNYEWPGNVRELSNVIERIAILCKSDRVGPEHFPNTMVHREVRPRLGTRVSLAEIEEEHIRQVLASTRSLQEAADVLGIDQATLWRKRKHYCI